jgi:hypothetical protein
MARVEATGRREPLCRCLSLPTCAISCAVYFPTGGGRAALNEAALRRRSRGERGAVKLAPLRLRAFASRAKAGMGRRVKGERIEEGESFPEMP